MSEEQMNVLIGVLKNIRDELEILSIPQSNRKYMRRLLEVRQEMAETEKSMEEIEGQINSYYENGVEVDAETKQKIDSLNLSLKFRDRFYDQLSDEEDRLKEFLAEDIEHNNGYVKIRG